jgi:hypothetical protein
MSFATLILLVVSGFSAIPGIEYTEKGEKILVDLLWSSKNFNVPADLLLSQYYEESRHKYWAVSEKRKDGNYDIGFVQMNTKFIPYHVDAFIAEMGRLLTKEEMYQVNIMLGAFVLSEHMHEFKDTRKALLAYVGGASNVRAHTTSTLARQYASNILIRRTSPIQMEEVLASFVLAVFESRGHILALEEVKRIMWALPPLKQRSITRENFLTIFKK